MDFFNSSNSSHHPSFNSTLHHASPPSTAALLANTLGLGSLTTFLGSAGGGAGGIAGLSILLSSILPLLMSSSSWARGFLLAPGRWLLDFFFVTAFIETSSPVSAWLSSYLSSLPKILTSKEVGVEIVKDTDAELEATEQAPKEFDPYSGRSVNASLDQNRE
ncbi:hypothetical protein BDY24DRAFT_79892 [Mrakia frigida]|uniref:uncharacterized protein n=1 Tax=Mrakia frigida TaxID=29902 RepID=UPI003FCC2252